MNAQSFDRRAIPSDAVLSSWIAPDGWKHRRFDWPQAAGTKSKGSLLYAAGRGDFIEKYLEAYGHWHGRGWNVGAFDWRGQGESRGSIVGGHLDSLDVLVGDMAALIADWQARTPGPHVVVGHSMGGHILLRTLIERPPAIRAAVLVAPMIAINSMPVPAWGAWPMAAFLSAMGMNRQPVWRKSLVSHRPGSARQASLTRCPERYQDELWWWQRRPGFNLGAPSWGWLEAAYRSSAKLSPEALATVKVPLLLIATERDRLVSAAAVRRASAIIPGAEMLMFQDAAHEILRERDGTRLEAFARIDTFFDEHADG